MGLFFFCCFGSVLGPFFGKIWVRLGSVYLDFGSVKTIGDTAQMFTFWMVGSESVNMPKFVKLL